MKNQIKSSIYLIFIGLILNLNAQHRENYSHHSKKNIEEAVGKYHKTKEETLIERLEINKDKESAFRKIFEKYNNEAMTVIRDARKSKKKGDLSDDEIKERIYARFEVYQKLLNHRRRYTEEFLKILSPKQLEKMFEMERQMGRMAMEKRYKTDKNNLKKEK